MKTEMEKKIKIYDVLKKGKISDENYNSIEEYFFIKSDSKKFNMEFSNNTFNKKIPLGLNRNVCLIYKIFGNPLKEIYLGNWIIFSLKNALEQYEDYKKHNQNNIFNIGYRYLGLGNIEIISCDLSSHLLFLRPDGGSNGYDREYHYNKIIKEGSKGYNQMFFSEWFYEIKI
jgi:hypothetical protein